MALFITFEGPDGSGKTTILNMIAKELQSRFKIYTTREPGGTEVSEKIREILLDPSCHMGAKTEALLYAASRAEHVEKIIRPKLQSGTHVLCDRYVLSSLAYQGAGRELGIPIIKELNDFATDQLEPDLTLFFDVDPLTVLERKNNDRDRLEL
ncbi:MAG: dTMP kinase, partial [Tissierellia bacterium]|nr:dTMP kinase [Tissierellia bacterium]